MTYHASSGWYCLQQHYLLQLRRSQVPVCQLNTPLLYCNFCLNFRAFCSHTPQATAPDTICYYTAKVNHGAGFWRHVKWSQVGEVQFLPLLQHVTCCCPVNLRLSILYNLCIGYYSFRIQTLSQCMKGEVSHKITKQFCHFKKKEKLGIKIFNVYCDIYPLYWEKWQVIGYHFQISLYIHSLNLMDLVRKHISFYHYITTNPHQGFPLNYNIVIAYSGH